MVNSADYRSVLENFFGFYPASNQSGPDNINNLKFCIVMDNLNHSHELNEKHSTTTPIQRYFTNNDSGFSSHQLNGLLSYFMERYGSLVKGTNIRVDYDGRHPDVASPLVEVDIMLSPSSIDFKELDTELDTAYKVIKHILK